METVGLVSVILPAYNGSAFIVSAISSALRQTHRDLEVIVIDDGSTDGTSELIESEIDDARLRVFRQPNSGVAAARNKGMALAQGDVLAFLDQDDLWDEEKLEKQLPYLGDDTVAVVGCYLRYLGERGVIAAVSGESADEHQSRIAAAKLMPFAPSSMLVRTRVARQVGGFDEELVREVAPIDDLDFLARIAASHRVVTAPLVLGCYRVHEDAGSFSSFYRMQVGTRFLQARQVARGAGSELTWESWSSSEVASRARRRADAARYLYRTAGMKFASGKKLAGFATMASAFVRSPSYVSRRIVRQVKAS